MCIRDRSETQTYLKVGLTAIVLAMIDDDYMSDIPELAEPVRNLREISYDIDLENVYLMKDGRRLSALDLQWIYLENASRYIAAFGAENLGGIDLANDLISRWEFILGTLKTNPEDLSNEIDWIAKRRLYEGFKERHQLDWNDPKLAALDLQYHDLRPNKCLARRMGLKTLVSESEVTNAISNPPLTTRAYFRGRCLQEYPEQVVAANWDSMVFDTGSEALRRVPTLEPLRGTASHVAKLLDECEDAGELLRRLGN